MLRVEVLLVVAIFVMLTSVAVPVARTPSSRHTTDDLRERLAQLRCAINDFHADHGRFPASLEEFAPREEAARDAPRCGAAPVNPVTGTDTLRFVDRMPERPEGREAWLYAPHTGEVRANVPGLAPDGMPWFRL